MGFLKDLFMKQEAAESYDPSKLRPAVRASICTGEKVAGFMDLETKRFREVELVKTPDDLEKFKKRFGIEGEVETIY